jgi:hypothetical protein
MASTNAAKLTQLRDASPAKVAGRQSGKTNSPPTPEMTAARLVQAPAPRRWAATGCRVSPMMMR